MATVLLVDDEASVRRLVGLILKQAGYDVIEAEDGLAAYNLIRERRGALDLVITDVMMPRMDGAELIARIESEHPKLKVLCISGYADPMSPNGHYFLAKPFTATALCAMVEKVMDVSRSIAASEDSEVTKSDERRRTQSDLHSRLVAAEANLETANEEFERLTAMCADAVDSRADSRLAFGQAMKLRKKAFSEYRKALQDWTDFHFDAKAS